MFGGISYFSLCSLEEWLSIGRGLGLGGCPLLAEASPNPNRGLPVPLVVGLLAGLLVAIWHLIKRARIRAQWQSACASTPRPTSDVFAALEQDWPRSWGERMVLRLRPIGMLLLWLVKVPCTRSTSEVLSQRGVRKPVVGTLAKPRSQRG